MTDLIKEERIAIDVETSGLRPFQHELHLISVGNEDKQKVINFHTISNTDKLWLKGILEDRGIEKVGHNIAFDALWLSVKLHCKPVNLYDTMVMEKVSLGGRWLGDSDDTAGHGMQQYNLIKTLERNHLVKKGEGPDKSITKSFIGYTGSDFTEEQLNYAVDDIKYLLPLRDLQWEKIVNFNLTEVARMEKRFTEVLVEIQHNGIIFNLRKWIELYNESKVLKSKAEKYLLGKKFISWSSPKQVLETLHELGIDVPDTNSNTIKYYLRDNKMVKMKRTILERLLEYRLYNKRVTSFGSNVVDSVDPDGKIRGNFNQLLATGRMSSMKPNLQQIPHDSANRECFEASPGKVMVNADYSSQELAIIATGSGEQLWLDTIRDGKDLHSMSAALLFDEKWETAAESECNYTVFGKKCSCPEHKVMRDAAKTLSFGLAYGLTYKTYALRMGITEEEGAKMYDKYFEAFPHVEKWLHKNASYTKRTSNAYTFKPFKRWRRVTDAHNYRKQNIGKNTPVQGTGGDMMKLAAIKIYNSIRKYNIPAKLLLLVHDEVVTECHPDFEEEWSGIIKQCMEDAAEVILGHDFLKAEPMICKVWKKD